MNKGLVVASLCCMVCVFMSGCTAKKEAKTAAVLEKEVAPVAEKK